MYILTRTIYRSYDLLLPGLLKRILVEEFQIPTLLFQVNHVSHGSVSPLYESLIMTSR